MKRNNDLKEHLRLVARVCAVLATVIIIVAVALAIVFIPIAFFSMMNLSKFWSIVLGIAVTAFAGMAMWGFDILENESY